MLEPGADVMPRGRRWPTALACLLIAGAAVAVTLSAWDNSFVLDDHTKIGENADLRSLDGLPGKLVYPYGDPPRLERNDPSRPLVFLAWTLVYHWAAVDPAPYRALNALFHALCAVFVFLLLRMALHAGRGGAAADRLSTACAFALALLFAWLPIQVGTVVYAYGLSDVMGAAFVLASILLHFGGSAPGWRIGSLLCFALALLSKQSTVVLPALLLAFEALLPAPRPWRARLLRLAPHAALAALYLVARWLYFGSLGDVEGAGEREPFLHYVAVQPLVILRYLWLTVVPHGLAIDHYVPREGPVTWLRVLGWAGLGAILAGAALLARRGTVQARLLVLGIVFYAVALLPTSSLWPTVDPMVERRVYLANAGLLLAAAVGLRAVLRAAARRGRAAVRVAVTGCAVLLAVYGTLSLRRNEVFASSRSLWRAVLEQYPNSPRALNNFARELMRTGAYVEAYPILMRMVRDNPHPIPLSNLAFLLDAAAPPLRDHDRALAYYERAIQAGRVPTWAYFNAARLHQQKEHLAEAARLYAEGLRRAPENARAHNELGILYARLERFDEAERSFREALRLDPQMESARRNLALVEKRRE